LDFRFIHVYPDDPQLDARAIAGEMAKMFPKCKIDIRPPFPRHEIERARISDVKQPFEKQPEYVDDAMVPLYDGFVLQRLLAQLIPDAERDHLHMVFSSLLACTFSEDDWRYHGRTVVCGTPSIISTTGIVEAPAKPREFYLAQYGLSDIGSIKKKFAGRFIDYGDSRITSAAANYALQAIFFFVTDGEPFCENKDCLLFNPHWQEELVRILEKPRLCSRHHDMANKFNKRLGAR
jgi:hypothetical protein